MRGSTPSTVVREKLCHVCSDALPAHLIKRCPVCFRSFCRRCAVLTCGRRFCSTGCGRFDAFYDAASNLT